jgi:hypothetical protein
MTIIQSVVPMLQTAIRSGRRVVTEPAFGSRRLFPCRVVYRIYTLYNAVMIISFRHKGLETCYRTGSTRDVQAAHAAKLTRILQMLMRPQNPAAWLCLASGYIR